MNSFISGLAPALNAMLDYREALGFSRQSHLSSFKNFDQHCATYHPDKTTLDKDMAITWLHNELKKPRSNINGKATSIRLLGKYLNAIGQEAYVLPDDFVSRKQASAPYVFTDAEISALFDAADKLTGRWDDRIGLIAPVMFRLIYTCGLRPNEGRRLLCANIDLDTGEILVIGTKRKKERFVVMSDDMLTLCRKYDQLRKSFGKDNPFLFPGHDGEPYTEQRIDRLFKRCWAIANPDVLSDELPNVRVYDLRHRFASAVLNRWLDEGRDLYAMLPYLRAYMGHTHMSETAYYIHILPENLLKSAGIDWTAFETLMPEVIQWHG